MLQAASFLYPFIGKQVVNIDNEDLLKLAYWDKVKIENLSEKAKDDIKETGLHTSMF